MISIYTEQASHKENNGKDGEKSAIDSLIYID